ncbi:hypothetical protein N7532_001005 [Penicillium argentinense]|uniref:Methylated-DNA-[protein]-cysteine S-methyltransferase DNA binding domain-containing protein n=1 Tax=Penicillium argentinense TaxID=1131581 RepID=A0A9W9G1P9_9EURO|nr:uncharacterized protein N7532_001005 [Penicillium argentinense]KAJ5110470.1 hypothetical protein N7532_001005 [Penicillium argentinense]
MPRSQEAEAWANAVYAAVQEIPLGKVTSYGHIALLLGELMLTYGQRNDHAKSADDFAPVPPLSTFIFYAPFAFVSLTGDGSGPGSAERQAAALRSEGVEVKEDSMGEYYVDLSRFGWFPRDLPSEDGDSDEEEE